MVQKLNCFPALSKVDLPRNLEYSNIIRVRIVGNVGNKIIPLHFSKAYLKALAKHYDIYNHLLEPIQIIELFHKTKPNIRSARRD